MTPPAQIFVILGASNVTLSWPRLIALLASRFSGPTHIYNAHGMGRSYLFKRSSFGARQLPGILHCDLWRDLPDLSPDTKTYALVTDLGNDLLYGSDADRVAESAEEAVRRLQSWSSSINIVVTEPPVESIEQLGQLRFSIASCVLFPMTRLGLTDTKQKTIALSQRIRAMQQAHQVSVISTERKWYGLDPIHVRRRYQTEAFSRMISPWLSESHAPAKGEKVTRRYRRVLRRPKAKQRWLFRRAVTTAQPFAVEDQVSIFSY